jgi:hypothetical protein
MRNEVASMQCARQVIVLVIATLAVSRPAPATTVDFNSPGFTSLPYAENGLTFSTMPGTTSAGVANGRLVSGTNFTPIHIRATGIQPFDLLSLNIASLSRTWRIESSSGAVLPLSGPGTVDFSTQTGWSNIVFFDMIHNPAEANGSIGVNSLDYQIGANSLAGDFNVDQVVNVADYVVWRKTIGTQAGYNAWRSHFGSGSVASAGATVAEPTTLAMLIVTIAGTRLPRRRIA